jgi:hypothetical protein
LKRTDPRGVWETMGPVRVEGPGLRYLRGCGFSLLTQSLLRRRCPAPRLDAELEKCGAYWSKRVPEGLDHAHSAIEKWLRNAGLNVAKEQAAERRERAQREYRERIRKAAQLDHAVASRANKVIRERELRAENAKAQADARWQAKLQAS